MTLIDLKTRKSRPSATQIEHCTEMQYGMHIDKMHCADIQYRFHNNTARSRRHNSDISSDFQNKAPKLHKRWPLLSFYEVNIHIFILTPEFMGFSYVYVLDVIV
ncbi:uncharacterized protein LOC143912252 [Arctopsyche grandis]|uniref:uncharacterized protein LOC143912252 n=1 Tax=Arctopsyche grandis TaxID=121162 RepID=UPI00406D828B